MDHGRAQKLLHDYLDGELSEPEVRKLELHLEDCQECRAELDALRETLSMLSGLKRLEPSSDFLQQVNQKIRRHTKSPFDLSFGLERKLPFEAVSMVLLGILLALYLLLVVLPEELLDPDPPPSPRPDAGAAPSGAAADDPSTRVLPPDAGMSPRFAPSGGEPKPAMRPSGAGQSPRGAPMGGEPGPGTRRPTGGGTDPRVSPSRDAPAARSKVR